MDGNGCCLIKVPSRYFIGESVKTHEKSQDNCCMGQNPGSSRTGLPLHKEKLETCSTVNTCLWGFKSLYGRCGHVQQVDSSIIYVLFYQLSFLFHKNNRCTDCYRLFDISTYGKAGLTILIHRYLYIDIRYGKLFKIFQPPKF
jgi:hypothetical protein